MKFPDYDEELTKTYNLPGVSIINKYKDEKDYLCVEGFLNEDYEEEAIICPQCGSKALTVSNTDTRSFNDFIINPKTERPFRFGYANLKIKFKRYLCKECGKRFPTPSIEKIASPNSRNTFRMENVMYDCGLWNSYTQVPNILEADISPNNVVVFMNRKIKDFDAKNARVLPESIGVHKVSIGRHIECYFIISTKEGLLLDILDDTDPKTLKDWFNEEERDISKVTEIVADYVPYDNSTSLRELLTGIFPEAKFMETIDSFVDGVMAEMNLRSHKNVNLWNRVYTDLIAKLVKDDSLNNSKEGKPSAYENIVFEETAHYSSLASRTMHYINAIISMRINSTDTNIYAALADKYKKEKDALLCFFKESPEIYGVGGASARNIFENPKEYEKEEESAEEDITWPSWCQNIKRYEVDNGTFSVVRARFLYGKPAVGESVWKERDIHFKDGSEQTIMAASLTDSNAYLFEKRLTKWVGRNRRYRGTLIPFYQSMRSSIRHYDLFPLEVHRATSDYFRFLKEGPTTAEFNGQEVPISENEEYSSLLGDIQLALDEYADDFPEWQKKAYLDDCKKAALELAES